LLIISLSNINTELVINTESVTDAGKAYTGVSNTLEPRALRALHTPVYNQDVAQIFILKG